MRHARILLAGLAFLIAGLVVAQSMMGGQNDPQRRGDGPHGWMGQQRGSMMGPGPGGMAGSGAMGWGQRGMMGTGGMAMGRAMMGHGMMGSAMGPGMMGAGGMMQILPSNATPLSAADLRERLEAAAASFGQDVQVTDVMPFANHTYAQFVDEEGNGVAEMLVDRYTGLVSPEPGPNMMWNRAMGMGFDSQGRYDEAAARELAEEFLAGFLPGAEILAGQAFPGYVTFDYGRDGGVDGMFSVNATTGLIWLHTWHGAPLDDEPHD